MFKKLITILLSVALLLPNILSPVRAIIPGEDTVAGQYPSNIDMNLYRETQLSKSIFSEFQSTVAYRSDFEAIQNPLNAEKYIPQGARCTEICLLPDVIIIDYRINNVRYLVSYYSDGTIEKTARSLDSDMLYTVTSTNMTVVSENRNNNKVTVISTPDQDIGTNNGDVINSQEDNTSNSSARSSAIEVDPLSYTECPSTAPYNARVVKAGLVMIEAFVDTDYGTLQNYRIYETMDYHSEVTKSTLAFSVGATLVKISSMFLVPVSTVKLWLTAASVAFSTAGILQNACQIIDEHAYTFLASKECGIYDVTYWNTYVETYQVNAQGRIVMTWDYDSETGYRNPKWGHSSVNPVLAMDNSDVLAEGKWSYNAQIYQFGFWHTGVGNGFGY